MFTATSHHTHKETKMLKLNLQQLRLDLQAQTGMEYSWPEIAHGIDEHNTLVYRYVNNRSTRVDLRVLEKFLTFFQREGLNITHADLFTVTPVTPDTDA